MTPIPDAIHGQRYISLATFRKSGVPVYTPIWFAENAGKLYFMTNMKLGKCKRIRNNPQVKIAPCTIRGKITGPEFPATARFLPPEEFAHARPLCADIPPMKSRERKPANDRRRATTTRKEQKAKRAGTLADFFAKSPLCGSGLKVRRPKEHPRKIRL